MNKYLITGATGYIGSMLVRYIKSLDENAQITVLVRNVEKAKRLLPADTRILSIHLEKQESMKALEIECDAVIHCASVTDSSEMMFHPVEVIESIVNTTQNVLELARRCKPDSFVYLSSMEVYGKISCDSECRISENELGNLELLNVRSCYPIAKRMAENICYSYYKEYGIPVKIARLAQTFGSGVLASDHRVFVQFANAVKNGTDIILHTKGNSMGNYCGIDDAVSGIMMILKHGINGEAYNVVNEANTMSIRQMAELVAEKVAGGKIQVIYDIPSGNPYGYAADTGLRLSGKKLEMLGWKPVQSLEDMYHQLLKYMEELDENRH